MRILHAWDDVPSLQRDHRGVRAGGGDRGGARTNNHQSTGVSHRHGLRRRDRGVARPYRRVREHVCERERERFSVYRGVWRGETRVRLASTAVPQRTRSSEFFATARTMRTQPGGVEQRQGRGERRERAEELTRSQHRERRPARRPSAPPAPGLACMRSGSDEGSLGV